MLEEERVIADLRRAGIEVSREQERFALAGGWLRGKIDAIGVGFPEAPKAEHVVEIKSLNASSWRSVQKHGLMRSKPEHWHQLHIGMAALGIARGAYIATCKDDEQLLVERIHLDVEELRRLAEGSVRGTDDHRHRSLDPRVPLRRLGAAVDVD